MRLPSKQLEMRISGQHRHIIAVDEVGMGCLAGPVVVCAILYNRSFFQKKHPKLAGIRDSKQLSAKQRETFAAELTKTKGLDYKVCYCYPRTIDKLNIYQAARRAMARAVARIQKSKIKNQNYSSKLKNYQTVVLVDGPTKIKGLNLPQIPIVKGDRKVFSIACASIIAKVFRDKMMVRYAKKYPNYGFERHKGYGTKYHVAQLTALGPVRIHRKSFTRLSFWTKDNRKPWLTDPKI